MPADQRTLPEVKAGSMISDGDRQAVFELFEDAAANTAQRQRLSAAEARVRFIILPLVSPMLADTGELVRAIGCCLQDC